MSVTPAATGHFKLWLLQQSEGTGNGTGTPPIIPCTTVLAPTEVSAV